jgi:hypothetical protein
MKALPCLLLCITANALAVEVPPSWSLPPAQQKTGVWWREHWYERGAENHNPAYEKRLRVNPPEVVLHEEYGKRVEARENGLMLIEANESLFSIQGAELAMEMWGGHPGTEGKRVTLNGRRTYPLPFMGTEQGHCTYSHPVLPLKKGDLVNGWNAVQLALDQGTTFWGHMMVDEAVLRMALKPDHQDIAELQSFDAKVEAIAANDAMQLTLKCDAAWLPRIASVHYQAWYAGYDENGDTRFTDWHGFTKNRVPEAYAAQSIEAPFAASWDTSMLPAQKNVALRAIVRLKDQPSLAYVTAATTALSIADRAESNVHLHLAHDLPISFWARAKQHKRCHIHVDVAPEKIEAAELHVVAWTGGPGTVKDYFTLNGKHLAIADGEEHEPLYSRVKLTAKDLRQGDNEIILHSDTLHHGIEIVAPGPALIIRARSH